MTPIRTLTLLLAAVPFLSSLPGQAPAVPTKPAEPAVYDEAADARQQIAKAVTKAKHENQRVLIEWGANWCGWCKWLAATMKKDPGLSKELMYEYQVVHIDVGHFDKHMDVAKELGANWKGIPYLTILDADGKPIAQADTEPFEAKIDGKNGHDAAKVVAFLKQHEAKPLVAADVLAAALATAQKEQKRVAVEPPAPRTFMSVFIWVALAGMLVLGVAMAFHPR